MSIDNDEIGKLNKKIIATLLMDRTTNNNILWGTSDYEDYGAEYSAGNQMKINLITGWNSMPIHPRVFKEQNQKEGRTRERAEVFTPSWVCNAQNNLVDEQWFGKVDVFNQCIGENWITTDEPISFPEENAKSWKKYVDAKRLEITCGEAPYLVSRYDSVSGEPIPIKERIGLLDRKLRVVNENTNDKKEWMFWARRAIESIYGYEFQGDNLLLARVNIYYTYVEYYKDRFGEEPDAKTLNQIALVISWNLWQMDGFNCAIPYCDVKEEPYQTTIFDFWPEETEGCFDYSSLTDTKGQELCKIHDWRSKKTLLFKNLMTGGDKK